MHNKAFIGKFFDSLRLGVASPAYPKLHYTKKCPMNKLPLISVAALCVSCATYQPIRIVETKPENCTFLAVVSDWFRGNKSGDISKEYEKRLKELTKKLNGDTLFCCWEGGELWGYDRKGRGGIVYEITGEAYDCSVN